MQLPSPYPFQTETLDDLRSGWKEADKQLVVSPTGSGKTGMFSWLTEEFVKAGHRALILVDQNNLIEQTLEKLRKFSNLFGDVEQAENWASLDSKVVLGSVQTMFRQARLERWPENHFGLVICDEADKSIADTWQTILRRFDKHAKVAGFTATPHRTDQRNLGCYYQRKVEKENLKSLITKGYLAPIRIERLPIKLDLSAVHMEKTAYGSDYDKNELDELLRPHLEEIAKEVRDRAEWRKTVVFLPLIKTAEAYARICRDLGISADYIYGEDPDRDSKWKRFQSWDFDVLANSMLLTRGVDDPAISCIVPCRPTKSVTLYFQMVGRGTRLHLGKADMLLIDFLYQSGSHLICRPAHLVASDDLEAELISKIEDERAGMPGDVAEQLDLISMVAAASSQREEALRKKLEEVKERQAQMISPDEFALTHDALDIADYQPVMFAECQAPTSKQMKWLEQIRVAPDGAIFLRRAPKNAKPLDLSKITSCGQASKILDVVFDPHWQGLVLASPAQRQLMRQMHYPNWESATADDAKKFFSSLRKRKEPQLAL